jgi:hypothetical protein
MKHDPHIHKKGRNGQIDTTFSGKSSLWRHTSNCNRRQVSNRRKAFGRLSSLEPAGRGECRVLAFPQRAHRPHQHATTGDDNDQTAHARQRATRFLGTDAGLRPVLDLDPLEFAGSRLIPGFLRAGTRRLLFYLLRTHDDDRPQRKALPCLLASTVQSVMTLCKPSARV